MGDVVRLAEIEKEPSMRDNAREVLEFLNRKTKRNFRPVEANMNFVLARLTEGYTVQDLKSVTAMKCREWLTDEVMTQFLRPATLFNKTKFSQYIAFIGDTEGNPE